MKSWTEGKLYLRKDGELAEFVGMREYTRGDRSIRTPVFLHSNGQELLHYWHPTVPFVNHDFNKDQKEFGHMCITDDDTKLPACC